MPRVADRFVISYATPTPRSAGEFRRACALAGGLLLRVLLMLAVMISLTAVALLTAGWIGTQVPALSP